MSKSIGNVVEPKLITHGGKVCNGCFAPHGLARMLGRMNLVDYFLPDLKQQPAYGADVLRLWVAASEYTRDVTIGKTVMAHVSESMRKIRTTARFMLSNIDGFSEERMVNYADLKEVSSLQNRNMAAFPRRPLIA
ncbi:LOW QUALITY PROTEIN: hypothetical protein BC936DRAFT_144633 [Jimgerdemannia flammicorona]|uniref:Aminoacyl-tRNA synthetase class Ia domain-containing protein n=1 Tax=Jimgerdemannia flammicorona TaxID=994334 RepID=A0A433DND9_9FUNG|nr:LOW QUALITY PROTEIN: hypothetical protein BC936DRAFT_144633 [Jimgerdemannia flammicorona]